MNVSERHDQRAAHIGCLRIDHGMPFYRICEEMGMTKPNVLRLFYDYVHKAKNNPPLPPKPGSIDELPLGYIVLRKLHRAGIHTIDQLEAECVEQTYKGWLRGIALVRGIGPKSREAIYRAVRDYRDKQ